MAAQFWDNVQDSFGNALPTAVATITNYPAGTPATIYASPDLTAVQANPFSLSSVTGNTGVLTFWAVDGQYQVSVTAQGTAEPYLRVATLLSGSGQVAFANYAALQAVTPAQASTGNVYSVLGRSAADDGGQGQFAWLSGNQSALVATDPLHGVYLPPASAATGVSGTWVRLFDGPLKAVWFGITLDSQVGSVPSGNTAAIQAAVNLANSNYISGIGPTQIDLPGGVIYLVALNYISDNGSTFGQTSIKLLDGVTLAGQGEATILRIKDGSFGAGAFYRLLSSHNAAGQSTNTALKDCILRDFVLDGNLANAGPASIQCGTMTLVVSHNITVERVRSINSAGPAIQINANSSFASATNIKVSTCTVYNATSIAYQMQNLSGLIVTDCRADTCTDNGFDFYGDTGTTGLPNLTDFVLSNCVAVSCSTTAGGGGFFIETCANGVIANNVADSCPIGFVYNQINSLPQNLLYENNLSLNCKEAFSGTGNTGGVKIGNNIFTGFTTAGLIFHGQQCSNIQAYANTLNPAINSFTGSITTTTLTISSAIVGTVAPGQFVSGAGVTAGTYIISGSGTSWVVNQSQTVASTAMTTNAPLIQQGDLTGSSTLANIRAFNNFVTSSSNINTASYVVRGPSVTRSAVELEQPFALDGPNIGIKLVFSGISASGGTAVITLPAQSSGILKIRSSSGGANYSVYVGAVAMGAGSCAITQMGSTFIVGQNNVSSVAGSGSALTITITFAATGAAGNWNASYEYI